MDESEQYEPHSDSEREPITEKVRIHGAQTAGSLASAGAVHGEPASPRGGTPGSLEERYLGFEDAAEDDAGPRFVGADEPGVASFFPGEPSGAVPLLPHWTDPPTGQVPAIVDRRAGDAGTDPLAAAGGGPSWREHDHEWEEGGFDHSFLADDDTRLGALGEKPLEERQPWEFDELATPMRTQHGSESKTGEPWARDRGSSPSSEDDDEETAHQAWWEHDDEPDEAFWGDEQRGAHEPVGAYPDAVMARSGAQVATGGSAGMVSAGTTPVASISSSPLRVPEGPGRPSRTRRGARARRRGVGERAGGATGHSGGRSMPLAVATGVGFAAIALLCFALGPLATLVLSTVVVTLAAAECYSALRRAGRRPATLLGLVATVGVMVSAYTKGVSALPLVVALVVMTSMLWYLTGAERGSAVEGITTTVLAFAWVGVLGSFAALMLAPSQYPNRHGVAFFLGAVVATVAEDVGALTVGRWLGRHPLAPRVSPHKTWEGAVGGAVLAVVASILITGHVHPWTMEKAAVLGAVVAVLAPLGDLCESLIKRDLGLKDMGSLLPGHGGVLDRVDAMLFVLPATYYLVRVLHLG